MRRFPEIRVLMSRFPASEWQKICQEARGVSRRESGRPPAKSALLLDLRLGLSRFRLRSPHHQKIRVGRALLAAALVASLGGSVGCSRRPAVVPVSGRVTLDGKPLEFGSVMIQPAAGPAARSTIGPGGTFTASTFAPGDGAIVGPATVRVACYEQQRPGAKASDGELALGKSLVPEKYTQFETSGIRVTIAAGMAPLEIELTSK